MHTRIKAIIDERFNGRKVDFAREFGWSSQYVTRLISGTASIGLTPILAIVNKFPELNARWLLTGEGEMWMAYTADDFALLLALEKYLPVMTAEEQQRFVAGERFDLGTINRWQTMLTQKQQATADIFAEAYNRQMEQCKQVK